MYFPKWVSLSITWQLLNILIYCLAMDLVEEFLELTRTVTWSHLITSNNIKILSVIRVGIAWWCVSARFLLMCPKTNFQVMSQVSVVTLVTLFRVLRTRIPARHLPSLAFTFFERRIRNVYFTAFWCVVWFACAMTLRRNLRSLVDLTSSDDVSNYPRAFWRWLKKKRWRAMMPESVQLLFCKSLHVSSAVHVFCLNVCGVWELRVDVLLEDPSRAHPFYVDKWDIFLPSDMWLGICAIWCQNMSHQTVPS